ncbi:MAG: sucrase ferredoxin [Pseudonocardia sp.]
MSTASAIPGPAQCAVLARALDEPLIGTAPVAPRWVCLEINGAWPRAIPEHPDPAVRALGERAEESGWRLVLIRRPRRRPCPGDIGPGPSRVYLADTAPPQPRTTGLTVPGPTELARLPLPAAGTDLPGTPVTDPLLLVCTHGRRDRCCALEGRALAIAVADGNPDVRPGVWECSHLGGHRFAPTALVLPTGYLYGRLDPGAAVDALKAAGHGEMQAALCRGRSTWTPAGQVAELTVREATGLRDAAALTVDVEPSGQVLVSARDGRRWAVDVRPSEQAGERPPSCGARPEPFTPLRAVALKSLA